MRFRTLACSLLVLGMAVAAHAGTMTPVLTVAHRYDSVTFAPLPLVFAPGGAVLNGQPGIYEVAVSFTSANSAGDKGWLNAAFGGTATNNAATPLAQLALNADFGVGWAPNAGTLDTNGATPGGVAPIFQTNQDAGTANDSQGIVVSLAGATIAGAAEGGNAAETRNLLGTAGAPINAGYSDPFAPTTPGSNTPTFMGSFFVKWNGLGQSFASLNSLQYSYSLTNGTATAADDTPGNVTTVGNAGQAVFGELVIIPEPATMSLLGLAMVGGLGMVRRRK